jgi:hypothetical protein
MGAEASTVPIFVAENVPASIRGKLITSWQMRTAFGTSLSIPTPCGRFLLDLAMLPVRMLPTMAPFVVLKRTMVNHTRNAFGPTSGNAIERIGPHPSKASIIARDQARSSIAGSETAGNWSSKYLSV